MPHFIIDCSKNVLSLTTEKELIKTIYNTTVASNLFAPEDIKVRITPFEQFCVGDRTQDYIHVFAHIMQGRTTEQRANLSKMVVEKLTNMFPKIDFIAMNVYEFEKDTYCNKAMLSH